MVRREGHRNLAGSRKRGEDNENRQEPHIHTFSNNIVAGAQARFIIQG